MPEGPAGRGSDGRRLRRRGRETVAAAETRILVEPSGPSEKKSRCFTVGPEQRRFMQGR